MIVTRCPTELVGMARASDGALRAAVEEDVQDAGAEMVPETRQAARRFVALVHLACQSCAGGDGHLLSRCSWQVLSTCSAESLPGYATTRAGRSYTRCFLGHWFDMGGKEALAGLARCTDGHPERGRYSEKHYA